MRMSALARDKWERPDYLARTIASVPSVASATSESGGHDEQEQFPSLDDMLDRYFFVPVGSQVFDRAKPQYRLAIADFRNTWRGATVEVPIPGEYDLDGNAKTKKLKTVDVWLNHKRRKTVMAVGFKAGGDEIFDDNGIETFNLWQPFDRTERGSDPRLFLSHVDFLFGDRSEDFLDWLAHIEQKPGELPHTGWLHIAEEHGAGRNWLAGILSRVWKGRTALGFDLVGMFKTSYTDDLSGKILATVDEIREGGSTAKWDNAEALKRLISTERREINIKYGRRHSEHNSCRWLIFSNHIDALALDTKDRRFNVVLQNERPMDEEYYTELYAKRDDPHFIAGVATMLKERNISQFNPGARAQMSVVKKQVLEEDFSFEDELADELIEKWPSDIITSKTIAELMGAQVVSKRIAHILRNHGYTKLTKFDKHRCWAIRGGRAWNRRSISDKMAELEKYPYFGEYGRAESYLASI